MVSALQNKSENLINGGVIVSDILSLAQSCYVCSFPFVKQEGNSVAHALALAQFARTISDELVWLEDPPTWLEDPLNSDVLSLANQ